MRKKIFKESFLEYCDKNKLEKNSKQIEIVELLTLFLKPQKNLLNFLSNSNRKLCFYLYGGVGLGKTMIIDFFFRCIEIPKIRLHFNQFMIDFHDFRYKNKNNSIKSYVKKLKKNKLIYLDEFQVTNIVDAMILGKLFQTIFEEGIMVIITSNIKIDNLYKDGLQREQFLPFISIIKQNSIQKELIIDDDYRLSRSKDQKRIFHPLNEKSKFKINQLFRKLTKDKIKKSLVLNIKGRNYTIEDFYEGIVKMNFKSLCDVNLGAEDYIEFTKSLKFLLIEGLPIFRDENINQQQRFITLIDIMYEQRISLALTAETTLEKIGSSLKLTSPFKRTISRLFELTSTNIKN